MAAPAIVGSARLRRALEDDPAVGETLAAARRAPTAVFAIGLHGADSVHVASGYLDEAELAALSDAGAVGDVLGRFLTLEGRIALPSLDARQCGYRWTTCARSRWPSGWRREPAAARSPWPPCGPAA